ncbi:MFS transporter [Chelativorans xinjiangense]|uniref:MFS transporter n=1 Tax=Chelativorans xinjiangense TaxID=2681485 RepID=UPI001915A87B|nr:MFS transporter [Chelativorans xinjiangense]
MTIASQVSQSESAEFNKVTPNQRRVIVAASIGNALEWFDFAIYGFFAATIARLFFPTESGTASLLLTFATFGVAFIMRPVGAVVIGSYADRKGRKAALSLSIVLMVLGTAMIALMPTYETIGIAAPILITLARLLQGLSAGGEFGSATALLAEQDPRRRGFFASWQVASQGLMIMLAASFGIALSGVFAAESFGDHGWRIPFLFGLSLGPVAFHIRRKIDESPEFRPAETLKSPLRCVVANQTLRLVFGIGAVIFATVSAYLVLFMPTYAIRQLGVTASAAFTAISLVGLIQLCLAPVFGHCSDRIGRFRIMIPAATVFLVCIYPLFAWLAAAPGLERLIVVQIVAGLLATAYFAPLPALLAELFPAGTRTSGLSLCYNLAVTVFGGFAPFIITWLIATTGSNLAPSIYAGAAAALSLIALIVLCSRLPMSGPHINVVGSEAR